MIKSLIHIVLAFSVFFSSQGFLIKTLYCQNELVKSSLFLNFGSCCEGEALDNCSAEKDDCNGSQNEGDEKDCCHDELSFYEIDQDQLIQETEFESFDHPVVMTPVIPVFIHDFFNKRIVQYFNYSAPLILYDKQVQLQTFLC